MNKDLDKIFDQALIELQNGASLEEAVLKCQPEQEHLAENLVLAQKLAQLPKKTVPAPAMRRKYALAPVKTAWYQWLHFSRLATVSMSLALFLSAVAGTGYAAYYSLPGQTLFAVKKTAENLQLQFASSQENKISLQVEFSKKRLLDAEKILKNPDSSPETAQAAVQELKQQTKNTLDAVSAAGKNDLNPQQAKTLVKTLETIATDQEKLAKEVKADSSKDLAANVEASAKVINNYIQVATNELEKSNIKQAQKSSLDDSRVQNQDTASTSPAIDSGEKATTSTSTLKSLNESGSTTTEPEITVDPNAASSGYIPETPEPQYVPSSTQPSSGK